MSEQKRTIYTYIEKELGRQEWWERGDILLSNRTNANILTTERVKLTL